MNRFSQFFQNVKDKLFGKKQEESPKVQHFTMDMPKPVEKPVARKRTRVSMRKQTTQRNGQRKHPLHASHFGTFAPIKPLRP